MDLLPSIASASQIELGEEIRRLKSWPFLHIDIEDGNFLPNHHLRHENREGHCIGS